MTTYDTSHSELQAKFEATFLDGEPLYDGGAAMLRAETVFEWFDAELTRQVVEARIDELRYVRDKLTSDTPTFINIQERIADLKRTATNERGK